MTEVHINGRGRLGCGPAVAPPTSKKSRGPPVGGGGSEPGTPEMKGTLLGILPRGVCG